MYKQVLPTQRFERRSHLKSQVWFKQKQQVTVINFCVSINKETSVQVAISRGLCKYRLVHFCSNNNQFISVHVATSRFKCKQQLENVCARCSQWTSLQIMLVYFCASSNLQSSVQFAFAGFCSNNYFIFSPSKYTQTNVEFTAQKIS